MRLGSARDMSHVALQQESCRAVSSRNVSSEQVWPFWDFLCLPWMHSVLMQPELHSITSTGLGLGADPSAEGF